MRIAPKPVKGQEVSLEQLLANRNRKSNLIEDFSDYWTLYGVKTMGGVYDIDLKKTLQPQDPNSSSFLTMAKEAANDGDFRPTCCQEFYSIAEFLDGHGIQSTEGPDTSEASTLDRATMNRFTQARDFLRNAWNDTLAMYTLIHYYPQQLDRVQHLSMAPGETESKADLKDSRKPATSVYNDIARHVFGASSWADLRRLIENYHFKNPPKIERLATEATDTCQVFLLGPLIRLQQHPGYCKRAILIKRREVKR